MRSKFKNHSRKNDFWNAYGGVEVRTPDNGGRKGLQYFLKIREIPERSFLTLLWYYSKVKRVMNLVGRMQHHMAMLTYVVKLMAHHFRDAPVTKRTHRPPVSVKMLVLDSVRLLKYKTMKFEVYRFFSRGNQMYQIGCCKNAGNHDKWNIIMRPSGRFLGTCECFLI